MRGRIFNILNTHWPHGERALNFRQKVIRQLEGEVKDIKEAETLVIAGDFNARLHGRREDEQDCLGNFIFG